jgi:addiction module RelE/StbE family toxin
MKLAYSIRAQADLLNIFIFLDKRSPQAARAVVRDIRDQIETLLDFPLKGMRTTLAGTRRLTIARGPYIVIYRLADETITIAHIRHTSRRPWQGEE